MFLADLFFYCSVAFLLGIAFASLKFNFFFFILIFLIFIFILLQAKFFTLKGASLVFLFLIIGFIYFNFYLHYQKIIQSIYPGKEINSSGIIITDPNQSSLSQNFIVSLRSPDKGTVEVITNNYPKFNYGDKIEIKGVILKNNLPYKPFQMIYPEVKFISSGNGFFLKSLALNLKNKLLSVFPKFLSADNSAFLGGLTFGERADFSKDFKNKLALSGTTHLIALSGYNVSLIVEMLGLVFSWFMSRRKTFYLISASILFFILMTGLEASIIRASIMGFLALFAKEIGRIYDFKSSLTLTAVIMNILNPTILIFDLGFILSFLSLIGIVYLYPVLKAKFHLEKSGFLNWKENALVTFSAQLMVLPIIFSYFHNFSPMAIFSNIFILEVVPLTTIFGFGLAFLGIINYYLAWPISIFVNLLLDYELKIIDIFSHFGFQTTFSLSPILVIAYYLVIIFIIMKFHYNLSLKKLIKEKNNLKNEF